MADTLTGDLYSGFTSYLDVRRVEMKKLAQNQQEEVQLLCALMDLNQEAKGGNKRETELKRCPFVTKKHHVATNGHQNQTR